MKNWLWGALGVVLLVVGLGVTSVGFLQPGLTCADDDSSAGCPATPFYSAMLGLGLVLTIVSIVFLVRAGNTHMLAPEAAVPFREVRTDY